MPKRDRMLGPVQIVLLHLIDTNVSRYGQALRDSVAVLFGEHISVAQVYIALNRLQERGLVIEGMSEPTKRKGQPRKMYLISPEGVEALDVYRKVAAHILAVNESAR
ncbi:PadR family transcriptional regulator [Patescibacteria group bacterium]|nr:PadR family transcriptional regulator [Patescibacteria group bacterium]